MKTFTPLFLFLVLSLVFVSCDSESQDGAAEGETQEENAVMTTEEFIAEAQKLGADAFNEKYPMDAEITLEGQVRAPATWQDKVAAKFGTGLNDLPLTADFMFDANGGKDATKSKVKGGETIQFTGKIGGAFFMDDEFKRCSFKDCIAK